MRIKTILLETLRGKDTYRVLLNEACRRYSLSGHVIDLGSGEGVASYYRFLQSHPNVWIERLDAKAQRPEGNERVIDLERDPIPMADATVDTVLAFNLLEHVYHSRRLLAEIKRVLKPGGRLLGAVPFLVNYHPDPRDYFRFTKEALKRLFSEELEGRNVEITAFGYGPATAGWSHIEQVIPRALKLLAIPLVFFADWIILKVRPGMNRERFPLGFIFTLTT